MRGGMLGLQAPETDCRQGLELLCDRLSGLSDSEEVEGQSGEDIVRQGQPIDHVFVARGGLTESYFRVPDRDDPYVLDMDFKGSVIGLVPAFLGVPHPISVRCVVPVTLLKVKAESLLELVRTDADLAAVVATLVSEQSYHLVQLLTDLKLKSATQRLAGYLLSFNDRFGQGGTATLPLRKKELARCVGFTQQSLSRSLRKLQDRGCVVQGAMVQIKDEEALRFFYENRWQ